MQSACQWEYYWLDSRRVHDAKGTGLAAGTIEALPTWPIFTAVDGGGLVASYQEVADGVRRGNAAPLRQDVAANSALRRCGRAPPSERRPFRGAAQRDQ